MAIKAKARTVTDFRAAHDKDIIIPRKIKAALEAVAKVGPEHYEYEADFIKLAGISTTDISRYREQFADYIVIPPAVHGGHSKRAYFGNLKIAKQLRGE